jgi:hypothetical protein
VRTCSRLCLALILLGPFLTLSFAGQKDEPAAAGHNSLAGMWGGTYSYADDSNQQPVKFQMAIVQDGNTIVGFMKEPNTFGRQDDPWLHAGFKGRFDAKTGKVTFTKTYDGTAGQSHDVEYSGTMSKKDTLIEGTWDLGGSQGRFILEKLRVDDKTLDGLK